MLSDEEKEALRNFKSEYETCDHYSSDLIIELDDAEIILNLIEKQSKEIEGLKKENLEIRDWKYVIDSPIDLDKLKELDLIKIKGKEYVSKDKIKAKIEDILNSENSEAIEKLIEWQSL